MNQLATKAKAICALLGSVLTAVAGVITDNRWLALAAAVCTAIAVYRVPNNSSNDEAGELSLDLSLIVGFLGGLFLGFLLWHR